MVPDADEPIVQSDIDETPTLAEQAKFKGWEAGVFNFGKAEDRNTAFFNPGLVERDDGLWLMVRRAVFQSELDFGFNTIWACKLNDDLTPHGGKLLTFPDTHETNQQFEDARCIKVGNRVFVSCCNFIWYADGSWTGAHQTLAEFSINYENENEDWTGLHRYDLEIDGNGRSVHDRTKNQKNWTFFVHDGKLHLHYSTHPWVVVEFGQKDMSEITPHRIEEGVQWNFGEMRGGSPAVRVGDLYWTFNHSSLPWTGRYRKYYMGAVAFEAKPPFKPVLYTPNPILVASQREAWANRKPLVVFPGGAVIRDNVWMVVYGINDMKSGFLKLPHEDLLKICEPVPEKFNPLIGTTVISIPPNGATAKSLIQKPKSTDESLTHIDALRAQFTSPVRKARIMKALKNSPILKGI